MKHSTRESKTNKKNYFPLVVKVQAKFFTRAQKMNEEQLLDLQFSSYENNFIPIEKVLQHLDTVHLNDR